MSPEQLRGGDVDARTRPLLARRRAVRDADAQAAVRCADADGDAAQAPVRGRSRRPASAGPAGLARPRALVLQALSAAREERPPARRRCAGRCSARALARRGRGPEPRTGSRRRILPRRPSRGPSPGAAATAGAPPENPATPPPPTPPPSLEVAPSPRTSVDGAPLTERTRSRPGAPAPRERHAYDGVAAGGRLVREAGRESHRAAARAGRALPREEGRPDGDDTPGRSASSSRSSSHHRRIGRAFSRGATPSTDARRRPVNGAHPSLPTMPAADWDPAVLDRARHDLATYLGPLARVIVSRV